MITRSISLLLSCGLLAVAQSAALAGSSPSSAPTPQPFSGAVNEVVKLAQSGVDQSVVLTYIKTSPGWYHPSADEILRLRDLGISSEVITAMLERGGELQQQAAQLQIASAAYSQPAAAPQSYSDYTENPQPPYAQTSPNVVYVNNSYPYYYPSYYGYNYGYSGYDPFYYYGYGWPYYRGNFYSYYPYLYSRYPYRGYYPRFGIAFNARFGGNHFSHGGNFNGGSHGGNFSGFHGTTMNGGFRSGNFSGGNRGGVNLHNGFVGARFNTGGAAVNHGHVGSGFGHR